MGRSFTIAEAAGVLNAHPVSVRREIAAAGSTRIALGGSYGFLRKHSASTRPAEIFTT